MEILILDERGVWPDHDGLRSLAEHVLAQEGGPAGNRTFHSAGGRGRRWRNSTRNI